MKILAGACDDLHWSVALEGLHCMDGHISSAKCKQWDAVSNCFQRRLSDKAIPDLSKIEINQSFHSRAGPTV